jgi:hypothetical protein
VVRLTAVVAILIAAVAAGAGVATLTVDIAALIAAVAALTAAVADGAIVATLTAVVAALTAKVDAIILTETVTIY